MILIYWFFVLIIKFSKCRETFTVLGLFHDDNHQSEMAFKYGFERYNMFHQDIKFVTKVLKVHKTDIYSLKKQVCEVVASEEGIIGIFGPESSVVEPMVRSIAINLEIPHITTNILYKTVYTPQTSINIYPDYEKLSYGISTLIREMEWKSFVFLYRDNEGLIRFKEVLETSTTDGLEVTVRQFAPGNDYRPILKKIKQSNEYNIVLDSKNDEILDILNQAGEIGLLEYYYNYLLLSLDSHMLNYKVLETAANITMIRFVDTKNPKVYNMVRDWEMGEQRTNDFFTIKAEEVTFEAALMHDAVNAFTASFKELHITEQITARPIDCLAGDKWEHGFRIATYMKVRPYLNGITSTVKFNDWGKRIEFTLEVVENYMNVMELIATYTPSKPDELEYIQDEEQQTRKLVQNLQSTTVMVSSRIGRPYLDLKKSNGQILEGNNRFEGYSLDLIDAISKEVNFTYEFFITEGNDYGKYDKETKTWNGIIRDLLNRKAHLGICDLTITRARQEAVDFSLPFMSLGVSILHTKAIPAPRNIFKFLEPLHSTVWLYMAASYTTVAFVIYFMARMSPSDWENPHPCEEHPKELENVWNMKTSFWLIFGSCVSAGCDYLPKGISTRMCISVWWFFILIINQSYIASLAAFLTMDKMTPTITGAESLAKQTKIKYGLVLGGSTEGFFKEANFSTYARMWTNMQSARPSVFLKNNGEGVKRVLSARNQGYAFLMESSSIDYEIERNCNLRQVGGLLDSKGYGIAMPPGSTYRSAINKAVLTLQEKGTLAVLKKKWWKEKFGGGVCDKQIIPVKSAELKLANVGGVFLVLGVGVGISFILCIGEFLWNVHKIAVKEHIGHKESLKRELLFAAKVWVTKKRTYKSDSASSSENISLENKAD